MKLINEVNGEINGEIKFVELSREEEQVTTDSRSKKANRRKKKGRRIERVRRVGKIERVEILQRDTVGENGKDLRATMELELEMEFSFGEVCTEDEEIMDGRKDEKNGGEGEGN